MSKLYKMDGQIATKEEFLADNKESDRTIGTYIHNDKVERKLIVHAYYSGIDHGPDKNGDPAIYEIAINGDRTDAFHKKYVGNKWCFHTWVETVDKYVDVVNIIKAGRDL